MDHPEARAALAAATDSRRRLVAVTTRPRWFDALASALMGGTAGAILCRPASWLWIVFPLLVAGLMIVTLLDGNWTTSRGRLTDRHAQVRQAARSILLVGPTFLLMRLIPSGQASAPVCLGAGLAIAVISYAVIRSDRAWQARRLRDGDFGPDDLT